MEEQRLRGLMERARDVSEDPGEMISAVLLMFGEEALKQLERNAYMQADAAEQVHPSEDLGNEMDEATDLLLAINAAWHTDEATVKHIDDRLFNRVQEFLKNR